MHTFRLCENILQYLTKFLLIIDHVFIYWVYFNSPHAKCNYMSYVRKTILTESSVYFLSPMCGN